MSINIQTAFKKTYLRHHLRNCYIPLIYSFARHDSPRAALDIAGNSEWLMAILPPNCADSEAVPAVLQKYLEHLFLSRDSAAFVVSIREGVSSIPLVFVRHASLTCFCGWNRDELGAHFVSLEYHR